MLTINGIPIHTNLRQYICLDCEWVFIGTRNTACPHCASGQTIPASTFYPHEPHHLPHQHAITKAPFTTG